MPKITSDFKAINMAQIKKKKKHLKDRGVLVSGYLKPSLVEIASAVGRLVLPVDPNFEKGETNQS